MLTPKELDAFKDYLILEEKSGATVEKYLRDVRAFSVFAENQAVTKEVVMAYKQHLLEKGYAVRSINSMLASVNGFLAFMNWQDCRVKSLKLQQPAYCAEEKELTKAEYLRLLDAVAQFLPELLFLCGELGLAAVCVFLLQRLNPVRVILPELTDQHRQTVLI